MPWSVFRNAKEECKVTRFPFTKMNKTEAWIGMVPSPSRPVPLVKKATARGAEWNTFTPTIRLLSHPLHRRLSWGDINPTVATGIGKWEALPGRDFICNWHLPPGSGSSFPQESGLTPSSSNATVFFFQKTLKHLQKTIKIYSKVKL